MYHLSFHSPISESVWRGPGSLLFSSNLEILSYNHNILKELRDWKIGSLFTHQQLKVNIQQVGNKQMAFFYRIQSATMYWWMLLTWILFNFWKSALARSPALIISNVSKSSFWFSRLIFETKGNAISGERLVEGLLDLLLSLFLLLPPSVPFPELSVTLEGALLELTGLLPSPMVEELRCFPRNSTNDGKHENFL